MSVLEFLVACAAVFTILWVCWTAYADANPAKTVEQESAENRGRVAFTAQHQPGLSIGDWSDEETVDPAYDAIEAIRPQIARQ